MKANGMKVAILGPFKVVFEPVTFQGLRAYLRGCQSGKTAPASAGSFKFARGGNVGGSRGEAKSYELEIMS